MKQVMHRIRLKSGYQKPSTLKKLMKLINKNKKLKCIVQGYVKVKGASALILGRKILMNHLNVQKKIFIDGTFKVNIEYYITSKIQIFTNYRLTRFYTHE